MASKRGHEHVEDSESSSDREINLKKRRKGKKRAKVSKKHDEQGKVFDLDGEDGHANDSDSDGAMPHQLRYYKGEVKELLIKAIFFMRILLLNMNVYPDKDKLIKWASKAFLAACQMKYGISYEGMPRILRTKMF